MRAKGNCSWVLLLLFLFLPDQKEDVTGLGRECLLPTLEIHIDLLLVKYFFFSRGGLCSEGKALADVGCFLSPPVDSSFTMGEDFAGTQAGTLQHCAQYLLVGVLQVFSPASGCFAFYCPWDVNQLTQQTVSLQNMYFSCKLNSLVDLRRACFHLVRHLFFLWEQQWTFPST